MSTLSDAMRALEERKTAVWGDEPGVALELDEAARLMVGLDLDVREVHEWSRAVTRSAVMALMVGAVDVRGVIAGVWVDGLLAGLLLADMRARDEARA